MIRSPSNEIDEAAALWTARFDRGLTPSEEAELCAWLTSDDRHLGAFGRTQALLTYLERPAGLARDDRSDAFRPAAPSISRRRWMQGALAAAGSAVVVGGAYWLAQASERYATRRGETRVIALADGSVITLNTASSARVHLSRGARSIQLEEGEALFEVAKDAARAFTVTAGELRVRVVGTRFAVQHLVSRPTQVMVQEGIVEAGRASLPPSVRLTANMRASVAGSAPMIALTVPADEVARELVWLDGRINFEGTSLAAAAAEFARYSETKIVINDADLAQEEVSGSFQATNPVGFGRAMAEALGAHVAVSDGEVRLYR